MNRRGFLQVAALSAPHVLAACGGGRSAAVPATGPTAAAGQSAVAIDRNSAGITVHRLDGPTLLALGQVGISRVRTTFYDAEHPSGDEAVRGAVAAGLKILGLIRINGHRTPREIGGYARHLADTYPEILAWQVLNEVDVPGEHSDRVRDGSYGDALQRAYHAIREANPAALVVASGLQGDGSYAQWIPEAYCDVLAIHAYGPPAWEKVAVPKLANVRRYSARPVWLTEYGFHGGMKKDLATIDVEPYRLREWKSVLEGNAAERLFPRTYGYVLHGDLHAIYDEDWRPRPVAHWLRERLHTSQ